MSKQGNSAAMPRIAMVFAAGIGSRMRPVTEKIPKPLVHVGGKALIDHVLDRFAENGVEDAIVNVHYLPDMVIDHLKQRKRPSIQISDERDLLLDQGGGIARVLCKLGEDPFFICNTDAFWVGESQSNLHRMADMWNPATMDMLMLVAPTAGSIGIDWPGDFFMDPDGRLTRRGDRAVAPFVYSGIAITKPQLFASEERQVFPLGPIFTQAAEKGRLFGLRLDGHWLHVGTPSAIDEANAALDQRVD